MTPSTQTSQPPRTARRCRARPAFRQREIDVVGTSQPNIARGYGTHVDRHVPAPIPLPAPALAIAAGGAHVVTLLVDGRVMAWGNYTLGQTGVGGLDTIVRQLRQAAAPLPGNVAAIGAGSGHSLALYASGDSWAWGSNFWGQLGLSEPKDRFTPVQVPDVNLN